MRLLAIAAASALLMLFTHSGVALADSATINVLNPAGQSDPAAGLPRTFSVTGATAAPQRVYVEYRNPGGAPCAPTANADTGTILGGSDYNNSFWGGSVNGNFNLSKVFSWSTPGTYMFCIYIASGADQSVTAITQVISFRSPTGTISATINPVNPAPGQTAAVTINGVSEAPENVYATVHSAATPCSQNYQADYNLTGSSSVTSGTSVNGNFSLAETVEEETAGNYVLCLWLSDSSSSVTSIAGPQPIPFTVGAVVAPVTQPTVKPGVTAECKKARSSRTHWTNAVKKTKKQLLHAKRKATRRKLTKRLASERRHLRIASSNVKVIC